MRPIDRKEPSLGDLPNSVSEGDAVAPEHEARPAQFEPTSSEEFRRAEIATPADLEALKSSVLAKIQARKEETPNIQPLGEVASEKIEALFGQSAKTPTKLGPAPSKMRYKFERLWLTPIFRSMARTALPLILIMGAGIWALSQDDMRESFTQKLVEARDSLEQRPEFQIELMKIIGVDAPTATEIRNTLNITFPVSSFELELGTLREKLEAMDSVASVDLNLVESKLLEVSITKRRPVLLWRKGRELEMLDQNGVRAGVITSRLDRKDLPLIAGLGAEDAIPEALKLFKAAGPLQNRLRGLRRMGERRWDMILDRGQIIQLPETQPIAALHRVIALQATQKILDKDVRAVDMRVSRRPILRMSEVSAEMIRTLNTQN
ncbi:MAG: cell division protein FtsQ/DivIB [Pseudomonadota bacterium]